MGSKTSSHIPILPDSLVEFRQFADALLKKSAWHPPKSAADKKPVNTMAWSESTQLGQALDTLSLLVLAQETSKETVVLPETLNTVLLTVRDALCVGRYVALQYQRSAGLENLMQLNTTKRLAQNQHAEFHGKNTMMSAVGLFTAASYMLWKLGSYKEEEASGVVIELPGTPEINLTSYPACFTGFVYYLAYYSQRCGLNSELHFLRTAIRYAEVVMSEIKMRGKALQHKEFFTEVSYQLKGTDFVIEGFEETRPSVQVGTEFKRVSFSQIVGNRAAKHEAKRMAHRMACYDVKEKKNPMVEFGGFQFVRMGLGMPGTGKSMQIAATATLLHDLCKNLNIPFLFWQFPEKIVSTFQGGSAEHMADWMGRLQDSNKIIYAPIDDGENNLEDRTRQGVSAGVREVIGGFLRGTEGASAIVRGNAVIEIFTNLPEQIDKAVLSRIQARFSIDGARTVHDFADQDHLWWKKLQEVDPSFINMKPLEGYVFMSDQQELANLSQIETGEVEPEDHRIKEVYNKLRERFDIKDHQLFAELHLAVQKMFPYYTSRDVRNIQSAVSARIMDFDLPDEWFEKPETFTALPYATKVEMIRELTRANMKGQTFEDIRLRETIKYLNSMARIGNVDFERQVESGLKQLEVHNEIRRRSSLKA